MNIDPFFVTVFYSAFAVGAGFFSFKVCLQVVIGLLGLALPKDDSDGYEGKRSGFRILTDNKTGVQYLQVGFTGPLTIRVDQAGYPITAKQNVKKGTIEQ